MLPKFSSTTPQYLQVRSIVAVFTFDDSVPKVLGLIHCVVCYTPSDIVLVNTTRDVGRSLCLGYGVRGELYTYVVCPTHSYNIVTL